MDSKKIAVILGAGASADAWNGPPRNTDWMPPLARELFGRRDTFWDVLKTYRGARVLAAELGELAQGDAFDLEQKLWEYATHADPRIRRHSRDVPLYLRDLLNAVVQRYTPGYNPGTHVRFVMRLLASGAQVAFLVLNYDDYVEMALADFDPALAIRSIDEYALPQRQALVFKLHGSVDWGVPMPDAPSPEEAVTAVDLTNASERVIFQPSRAPCYEWRQNLEARVALLYPVLTAPMVGKGQADLVCPPRHLEMLRTFLSDCHKYLVIGTSGLDEDLLGFLAGCAAEITTLHYVSDNRERAEAVQARFAVACPAFRAAASTVLYGSRFRGYTGSPEFEAFLPA